MTAVKPPRILIVDSDPDTGAELTRALEGFGHRAVWARDTGRAIEELRGGWADLVLMDATPATVGAADALACYAEFVDIPVILLSAMAEVLERLPYPCLCKPLRLADMRALIERELRGDFVLTRDPRHRPMTATTASQGRSEAAASAGENGRSLRTTPCLYGQCLEQRMSVEPIPPDRLIDPELLWLKSAVIRERLRTVHDEVVANRMRLLADDMICLAMEVRLALIAERTRR